MGSKIECANVVQGIGGQGPEMSVSRSCSESFDSEAREIHRQTELRVLGDLGEEVGMDGFEHA